MDLNQAKLLLAKSERHELRDHAFGDAEITWSVDGVDVAFAYEDGKALHISFYDSENNVIAEFEDEDYQELRSLGKACISRNDSTGPVTYTPGKVKSGLSLGDVFNELTSFQRLDRLPMAVSDSNSKLSAVPYREQALVTLPVRDKAHDPYLQVYDLSHIKDLLEQYNCPYCKTNMAHVTMVTGINLRALAKMCFPHSRRKLSGLFWWSKYCARPGFHHHFCCPECKTRWVADCKIEPTYLQTGQLGIYHGKYQSRISFPVRDSQPHHRRQDHRWIDSLGWISMQVRLFPGALAVLFCT